MARLVWLLFIALACIAAAIEHAAPDYVVSPTVLSPTGYQEWAHRHWIWPKNSDGSQTYVLDLVNGYTSRNIPIGAVNIDSTWATQYDNFEVDVSRFPDFKGLISQLHAQDLKVILWATSMINVENPDYDFCVQKKYLLRDSHGIVRPIKWWNGSGGLLDYSNPDALAWWHSKMDLVLDIGIDGFKCDGTDPYILEYILAGGALGYNDQLVTKPDYSFSYYRDFFYYTREKRAKDSENNSDAGLIMSRPIDCLLDQATKACTTFSPKDVMFSGWVGDDDATFSGMRGCLRKNIYSAWVGYGNFGCDIGGYRGSSETDDKEFFLRSAQLGSFLSLMENGGGGEHRPWMYDDETVDIYRKFAVQHHSIAPYMHTMGAAAVETKTSSMHPVDAKQIPQPEPDKEAHILFPEPSTFSYRLGDDLLIHPAVYSVKDGGSSTNGSLVHMVFPSDADGSNSSRWLDWWAPNEAKKSHMAGEVATRFVPLSDYAVYVREGVMLPLYLTRLNEQGVETVDMKKVVFTWFHPTAGATRSFAMRESVSTGTGMTATASFAADGSLITAELSAHPSAAGFEFVGLAAAPKSVNTEAWKTTHCDQIYRPERQSLLVLCNSLLGGARITIAM